MANTVADDVHMNGRVKWFNKKAGYGFINVTDGSGSTADVFVHHSALLTEVELFRYLVEGEYVKFTIKSGETNAVDVTGPGGGKLMCETRQLRRSAYIASSDTDNKQPHYKSTPRQQPHRKQVYVSGDIDDGCVWELVRRAPKVDSTTQRSASQRKGPRIVVDNC